MVPGLFPGNSGTKQMHENCIVQKKNDGKEDKGMQAQK